MSSLYKALTLSIVAQKRFVVTTNDPNAALSSLQNVLQLCHFDEPDYVVLDLKETFEGRSIKEFAVSMTDGNETFRPVIIWQNMQELSYKEQKRLYEFLLQLDGHDSLSSVGCDLTFKVDELSIRKPSLFVITSIISGNTTYFYQFLKERFWLSTYYHFDGIISKDSLDITFQEKSDYYSLILRVRVALSRVFIHPDVKRYIHSLVVFIRCHRLCSVAPKQARISTRAIGMVYLLSSTLVALHDYESKSDIFVTPSHVKLAIRKVGYWLVSWEISEFAQLDNSDSARKQLELSILTADWIGTEWKYAKAYFKESRSTFDASSPTGKTNTIVEDAIKLVNPPL